MSSPDTAQAAAAVTQAFLSEFIADGDENALRIAQQDAPPPVVAAPVTPVLSSPTPAAPAATATPEAPEDAAEPVEVPSFDPVPDDELDRLLEEPDFADEAAQEIEAEAAESDEYVDTDTAKRIRELEKRNAWLEQQNVLKSKKTWVAENLRKYPLLASFPEGKAKLEAIDATSRRAFALKAQAINADLTTLAQPVLTELAKLKGELAAAATVEARTAVRDAWGNPAVEPAGAQTDAALVSALAEARARRAPLGERLKILAGITKL